MYVIDKDYSNKSEFRKFNFLIVENRELKYNLDMCVVKK